MLIKSEVLGSVIVEDEFDYEGDVRVHAFYGPISKCGVRLSRAQVIELRDHLNKLLEENANPST